MSKQEENLQKLNEWFDNHHIAYKSVTDDKAFPKGVMVVTIGTNVCKIAICICNPEEEDDTFHTLVDMRYHPFFIREADTWDYTHEKIRNCTRGWNIAKVNKEKRLAEEKARKEAEHAAWVASHKRKRVRIHRPVYEKVEPIKH